MSIQYAKNRSVPESVIRPNTSLWKHRPHPVLIERCYAIAEFPYVAKAFAPKSAEIDYSLIRTYDQNFKAYDEIMENYLTSESPLFFCTLLDDRLNHPTETTDDYKKAVQYLYEVQCALTEFYLYLSKYHYQFRKTMLPLLSENHSASEIYLYEDLAKSYGSQTTYTDENAELLGELYFLYLRLSFGVKAMVECIISYGSDVIAEDVDLDWLAWGYSIPIFDEHYKLISSSSQKIHRAYAQSKDITFSDIYDKFFEAFKTVTGSFRREVAGEFSNEHALDNFFKVSNEKLGELSEIHDNGVFASKRLGTEALLKLKSDIPTFMLEESNLYTFELSIHAQFSDIENLVPEFIMYGGLFNSSRDCVNYPLIFDMNPELSAAEIADSCNDYLNEFFKSLSKNIMFNYSHVYYANKGVVFENQVKRRIDATNRN